MDFIIIRQPTGFATTVDNMDIIQKDVEKQQSQIFQEGKTVKQQML